MRTRTIAAITAAALLLPATSWAFSFGTFAPGEQILSVQLAAGNLSNPTISFDGTTNTMVFDASVSTITTNFGTYNIPLGDVLFSSTVMIVGGTEVVVPPFAPFYGGDVSASFANGIAADLSIVDVGPGGAGLLLAGDYGTTLDFLANSPGGYGFPIVGNLSGGFTVSGGDAAFVAAFGPGGDYFANLASFLNGGGMPVGSNLCLMIDGGCPGGTTIGSFTVNPAATITPIPEPGTVALLAVGVALLARRSR
jgi:hypothetical protein